MPKKQSTASKKARTDARQGAKFTTAFRVHGPAQQDAPESRAQSATPREDYLNELWDDTDVPEMAKVCLYALADDFVEPFWMDCTVAYSAGRLAAAVGMDEEAVEFSIDIAEEIGWVKDRTDTSLTLRYPRQNLDMWLGYLHKVDSPVTDTSRYEEKRKALASEIESLRPTVLRSPLN